MAHRRKSTAPTDPIERCRRTVEYAMIMLGVSRGMLDHAIDVLPPTPPKVRARMESGEIPFTLAASLARDIHHAVDFKLEEAVTELESALQDDEKSVQKRWEDRQG